MKIAYKLGQAGYLETVRGRNGGLRLGKAPSQILVGEVSSPGEFHPKAPSEPYVNLSAHTAPAMEPRRTPICQCANNPGSLREIRAIQCVARRKCPRSFLYFL